MVTRNRASELHSNADDDGATELGPRELRRQQRIALSREQILDTAEELFAEYGYHETGLKDVAARCEFSVGSIYALFSSKESLYEEVLLRYVRAQTLEAEQSAPQSMPADERLIALAEMQMEHMHRHPTWSAVNADALRIAMIRGAVLPEGFTTMLEGSYAYVAKIIAEGQSQGTVREGDPMAMAKLYFTLLNASVTTNFLAAEGATTDGELYLDFIRRAFTTRE